jgi:DNA-directed RNA polymerase specialized sigma24 family protein
LPGGAGWISCANTGRAAEEPQPVDLSAGVEIADLLARLPEAERAALILCEGHGWSHAEAAAMLGMPLGTLKSRIARAKERCRLLWEHSHDR